MTTIRTIILSSGGGNTVTLPASTSSGTIFTTDSKSYAIMTMAVTAGAGNLMNGATTLMRLDTTIFSRAAQVYVGPSSTITFAADVTGLTVYYTYVIFSNTA